MLNDLDRFHLVKDVIDRVPGLAARAAHLRQEMDERRLEARAWTRVARRGSPRRARLGLAVLSRVLVVNAGSTSLKLALVDEAGRAETHRARSTTLPAGLDAVGHRIVHGGGRLPRPGARRRRASPRRSSELTPLAPLHQRARAARARGGAQTRLPAVPHVAVFDTAFHATLPEAASTYAVPRAWRDEWGVRRFGFHGIAVQSVAERVTARRLVVCHLGGGCSVTAVLDGRSVDTTMGFTPLDGVADGDAIGSRSIPGSSCMRSESEDSTRTRWTRRSSGSPGSRRSAASTTDARLRGLRVSRSRRRSRRWPSPSAVSTSSRSRGESARTARTSGSAVLELARVPRRVQASRSSPAREDLVIARATSQLLAAP